MSVVRWETPKGNLGTIAESQYYDFTFTATDSDEQPLFYSLISGSVPPGMYVTREGKFRGAPSLLTNTDITSLYAFTVRATNVEGTVADRSFSIIVTNNVGPEIILPADYVGAWFDGTYLEYQFNFISDNPVTSPTFKVTSGSLPAGISLSPSGLLSGYVDIIGVNTSDLGYEAATIDGSLYDPLPTSTDRYYSFTIQCTDGVKFDTKNVIIEIISKGNFTADNDITIINNTFITIDANNEYRPIILNSPGSLPVLIAGSKFAYRFVGYDPEAEDISWEIDELAFSGMDDLDAATSQLIVGNGSSGPYTLDNTPINAARIVVRVNDILLTAYTDYTTSGNQLTFTSLVLTGTDLIEVLFIEVNTGFDTLVFDQGASGLPAGLSINQNTGWIFGTLPAQPEQYKTYTFRVTAYRTLTPTSRSDTVSFELTVQRTLNEEIVWVSPTNLGIIDNGAVSELAIEAYHTLGKELEYSIIYEPFKKIPQGLKFLPSGIFTGRTTFRYFSLDGTRAELNLVTTENLEVGMQVQGPGVASGCRITAILGARQIEVRPAIYIEQGTLLTFSNLETTQVVQLTSNAISTAIDNGATTFDQKCQFTVKAETQDGSASATRTFTVKVNPYNLAPYENIYLRSLPSERQRSLFKSIIEDNNVFPENLIYRPDDPNFGIAKSFKFLYLAGLTPVTASTFVNAIQYNHYDKFINFGEIKTAVSKNSRGEIVYEVVYVDAVDTQAYDTAGPDLEVLLNIENGFLYGSNEYKTIYPNSFRNMQTRLDNTVGYTNRGALPNWMLSVQENGLVLGLVRAIVLAYVKPGAGKLVAYRLQNSLQNNTANFSFVADRYQWDNYLSQFYNTETASFEPSVSTTFDKYVSNTKGGAILDVEIQGTVTNSTTVILPDNINVGVGWVMSSLSTDSTIPLNTQIVAISGNVITLNNTITASDSALIKIYGETKVDYAVSVPFNNINNVLLSTLRNNFYIDGVVNFVKNETIIFRIQAGFANVPNDGWIDENGDIVPGYLDKISGNSPINKRGGAWKLTWNEIADVGFDSDDIGFDQAGPEFINSYFDQGGDSEVRLEFVNEVLFNQQVYVRTGKSYPNSVLTYTTQPGNSTPNFIPVNIGVRTAETTFDGGTCCVRERDIQRGVQGIRGGTNFSTNRDKYVKPETKDKYIKFPQTGVFV